MAVVSGSPINFSKTSFNQSLSRYWILLPGNKVCIEHPAQQMAVVSGCPMAFSKPGLINPCQDIEDSHPAADDKSLFSIRLHRWLLYPVLSCSVLPAIMSSKCRGKKSSFFLIGQDTVKTIIPLCPLLLVPCPSDMSIVYCPVIMSSKCPSSPWRGQLIVRTEFSPSFTLKRSLPFQ